MVLHVQSPTYFLVNILCPVNHIISSTMDEAYHNLAKTIHTQAASHPKGRFIVAIAGIPGSGKTTTASRVVELLNTEFSTPSSSVTPCPSTPRAALLSMDGFHLPRATLDQLPNREEAYIRRGAPWTFDAVRFLEFMRSLRRWADQSASSEDDDTLYAPTFSHETKDPIENGTYVTSSISIIVVEGNYLLLDEPVWRDVPALVDYKVFIDTDAMVARERLAKRHVFAGIESCVEDGFRRVDANDYLNALVVREKMVAADLVVWSV
ncbi:P-loop containing nucleoside triphosphate hydrolase protein [Aspergillus steynii IBT 23096]|uniref:P-loop containing nucleoside triphosphate hydrolase protein n=1 Tax=Aspergillus steynii IBT 23096 TaxID=1392250 RepID=A0A2I2FV80_9EURO|nr:P-loop containing nucleoside triphosphate hydrolase protein [Aspergillus steynii IBT 23096]PLB44507.1 P-loop containing nucleoside triphosphate hydrolase protein [Aspergillus steynii IBT 23096]